MQKDNSQYSDNKSENNLLRCNWLSKNDSTSTFAFGSATFLTRQATLSCGQNIQAQSKDSECQEIYFYSGVNGNEPFKLVSIKIKHPNPSKKFDIISQSAALMVLNPSYEGAANYPKVGSIDKGSVATPAHMDQYFSQLSTQNHSIYKLSTHKRQSDSSDQSSIISIYDGFLKKNKDSAQSECSQSGYQAPSD